jgi:hypothetical protein
MLPSEFPSSNEANEVLNSIFTPPNKSKGVTLPNLKPLAAELILMQNDIQALWGNTPSGGGTGVLGTLYSGTLNLNETSDQAVNLSSLGNKFIITDIILYSPTELINTAKALQIWSGASKSGTQYYTTNLQSGDGLQGLIPNGWISFTDGDIIYGSGQQSGKLILPDELYISLGTAQGNASACSIWIIGLKVS